jgi:hypothetical protein
MVTTNNSVVPTLLNVDANALQRRDDLSIEEWRELAATLAEQRNELADHLQSTRERWRASTTTYLEGTEALSNLLGLSNDIAYFLLNTAKASKVKRKHHKSDFAQDDLLARFKKLKAAFTKAKPNSRVTDTAVVNWYFEQVHKTAGVRPTVKKVAAMSKTFRNLISAARKARPESRKEKPSG